MCIFSQNHHGPNGHGQPESARFRPNGPFRFWSSIYDPNEGTHQKNKIFGQNWPIDNCFPIFAFFDKFTSAFVFEFYVCLNFWKFISISKKIPSIFALK